MTRKNKTQLAAELGLNRGTLKAHLLKPDAPKPDNAGRYDSDQVRGFIAAERRTDNNIPHPSILRARCAKLQLECLTLKQKLDERSQRFVPIEAVEEQVSMAYGMLKEDLLALPHSVAPECVEKSAMEIDAIMLTAIKNSLRKLARQLRAAPGVDVDDGTAPDKTGKTKKG